MEKEKFKKARDIHSARINAEFLLDDINEILEYKADYLCGNVTVKYYGREDKVFILSFLDHELTDIFLTHLAQIKDELQQKITQLEEEFEKL